MATQPKKEWMTLAGRMIGKGALPVTPHRVMGEFASRCEAPRMVTITGHEAAGRANKHGKVPLNRKMEKALDLEVACRRCPSCLRQRANVWRFRALAEVESSRRTWFGTITLRPEEHFRMKLLAARRIGESVDFESMSAEDQFLARHHQVSIELTKYFKRIRDDRPEGIRYLLVAEAHQSGLPHYHCLIHEARERDDSITKAELQNQWKLGFTKFKLVKDKLAAFYVCKYLAKSSLARVRASIRYGECDAYFASLASDKNMQVKF